jgi:ribonuclease VapC
VIVVDSSAIIATLSDEPLAEALRARLAMDSERLISTVSYVESGAVIAGRRRSRRNETGEFFDAFLEDVGIELASFDERQARLALDARIRYGSGMGHGGKRNLGDCFSYALAKSLDAPLLYIGDDFPTTDIKSAL